MQNTLFKFITTCGTLDTAPWNVSSDSRDSRDPNNTEAQPLISIEEIESHSTVPEDHLLVTKTLIEKLSTDELVTKHVREVREQLEKDKSALEEKKEKAIKARRDIRFRNRNSLYKQLPTIPK